MTARRRWLVAFALAVVAAVVAAAGWAFYVATSTAGSSGGARVAFLPIGNQPAVSVSGRHVTVSWAQNSVAALGGLVGAQPHGGYTITRYAESAPSTPITAGANCSGTQSGSPDPLTCTESSLPTGRWKYTATPSYYSWIGGESSLSAHAIIAPAAPSTVTLVNGGGVDSAYINASNKTSLTIDVTLPATSLSSDTVALSLSDGVHSPVTSSQPATAGAGSVSFTGVDASSLSDGSITISATSSSSYEDASSATQIGRTKDTIAPVVHATASRAADSNGWFNHTVTFSASTSTDTGGSGIQSCDPDVVYNTPDTSSGSKSFNCTDAAGNGASDTITFKYDGTKPTDALTLDATPSHAFLNGTTLYYKGDIAGSFSIIDTVTDALAGPASATFPVFNTLGWTGAGGSFSTPPGGPYSSLYSWATNQTLNPASATVSSVDTAGNTSVGASWTITKDITAPTGAMAASGTSGGINLTASSVTDGGGSGPKSVDYYRCTGTAASCTGTTPISTPANWTMIGSSSAGGTWPVVWDSTSVTNGSYTLKAVLSDNVGNAASTAAGTTVAVSNSLTVTSLVNENVGTAAGTLNDGDKVVINFSLALDPSSVCPTTWTNTQTEQSTSAHFSLKLANGSSGGLSEDPSAICGAGASSSANWGSGSLTQAYGNNKGPWVTSTLTYCPASSSVVGDPCNDSNVTGPALVLVLGGGGSSNPNTAVAKATFTPSTSIKNTFDTVTASGTFTQPTAIVQF